MSIVQPKHAPSAKTRQSILYKFIIIDAGRREVYKHEGKSAQALVQSLELLLRD